MNKTAIKNFAIWARNKLIADIQYRAGLMGITADGIKNALPQSTKETEFYDIGTSEPYAITGEAIGQRRSLVNVMNQKADETNYKTAYKYIIEGVAYTWFNRLIAVRFMEINDYLPSHTRVLSSDSGKMEPDLVTTPFDADLPFTDEEKQEIVRLKNDNNLDEVFRLLFIKQCNALNEILPALFEKTVDYTELLLNISAIDKDGVVYHLVNDISEDDFNIEKGGQVEIIGWLYQYYNTEPKNEAFAKSGKITKEEIPAVTQLFTPDWIVRYMVENSLGRLWVEGHPNDLLKSKWKYYLEEAEQEPEVQTKLDEIHAEYAKLNPEDIHFIDPCMGSGHILVYAFDVLMQIYESAGYSERDAAKSILENNLYGLDIDDRAYQMAYFAVMMKARQYNRRILSADTVCHVYSIQDSNSINRNQLKYFGSGLNEMEKNDALNQIEGLLNTFKDAKEYGSILNVENYNWDLLRRFANDADVDGQMTLDAVGLPQAQERMKLLIDIGETMARKYEVVVTNPPYRALPDCDIKLNEYTSLNYPESKTDLYSVFIERCRSFAKDRFFISMITQQSWMSLASFEKMRVSMIKECCFVDMVQMGAHAFDEISGEVVTTVAFSMRNCHIKAHLAFYTDAQSGLSESEKREILLSKENRYKAKQDSFLIVPNNIIVFDASDVALNHFIADNPLNKYVIAKPGMQTSDNDRFLRLWNEVSFGKIGFGYSHNAATESECKWFPYNKGIGYRKWYGNNDYVVNYYNDGEELKYWLTHNPKDPKTRHWSRNMRNYDTYFCDGITFTAIGNAFSARMNGAGYLFDTKGPMMFGQKLKLACGFVNSAVFDFYNRMLCKQITKSFDSVNLVPFPELEKEIENQIDKIVDNAISISRNEWDSYETSWDFKKHPLI